MKKLVTAGVAALGFAAAFAMVAEANQADRRAAMKQIAGAAKAISQGTEVSANADLIAANAKMIPALFEANEVTGDSKALPAIWTNYADFTAKSEALIAAAMAVKAAADGGGDVGAAAKAMGGACGACHGPYKAK